MEGKVTVWWDLHTDEINSMFIFLSRLEFMRGKVEFKVSQLATMANEMMMIDFC